MGALLLPALLLLASLVLGSCGGGPAPREGAQPGGASSQQESAAIPGQGSVTAEIRGLTETGSPPALLRALDLLRSRNALSTEFGRVMSFVDVTLMQKLYPAISANFPPLDPPQTNPYTKIIRDAEKGNYTPPSSSSQDYLEYVLPFLALYEETRPERLLSALPDLEKGAKLNQDSVLAPFFMGMVYERAGRAREAVRSYTRARELSPECYPASLGLARVLEAQGDHDQAMRLLTDLVIRYPDNLQVKRQLAIAYYRAGDWSRAEPAIAEILQRNSRDREFILMRAHVLVERGQYLQAQTPLDLYASIDPNNRLYLFLRAKVQAEGYHNRDAALNYLRSLMRSSQNDEEVTVYTAKLLMESSRPEDQSEGRSLLRSLLRASKPSLNVMSLALEDAIRREAWKDARSYMDTLLKERRSEEDLLDAYQVERGQGNNAAALSYARELYERDPANEDGAVAYISALIDTGRQEEAGRMIERRLAGMAGGALKSRYYYLRSRIRTNEDSQMNDLRSSLFEDPRNLNAIIAMFQIYHRRRDESRAVFYLKQALAIAPDDPQLKRYQSEYASALGSAP